MHDVQYSQTYDELDSERNVSHSSVMSITSNSSTNKKQSSELNDECFTSTNYDDNQSSAQSRFNVNVDDDGNEKDTLSPDEPKKDWRKLHAAYKENWYTNRPPDEPIPRRLLEYIMSNCVTSKTPYEYDLDNPFDRKLHKLITTKVKAMKEMLADNDAKIEAEREAKKALSKRNLR